MISNYNNLGTSANSMSNTVGNGISQGLTSAAASMSSVSSSLSNILNLGNTSAKLSSALSLGKELGIGSPSMQNVSVDKTVSKPKKIKSAKGGPIATIIKIVKMAMKLPMRFDKVFLAFQNTLMGSLFSIEGLSKSFALGVYDILMIFYNISRAVLKYINCIISFIVTLPFCSVVHIITGVFYCIYMIIYAVIYPIDSIIDLAKGPKLMPYVDYAYEMIDYADDIFAEWNGLGIHFAKWPPLINRICYTCFGKKVKVRDVFGDISVVGKSGKKLGRDFSVVMPKYMKRSTPYLKKAMRNIEQVFKK